MCIVFTILLYAYFIVMESLSFASGGIQDPTPIPQVMDDYERILSISISLLYSIVSVCFILCGLLLIR